ncbi:MAG: hypothetical protein M5R36_20195 [Deltaproteobacteria bacterium]|nr:hypothetical protein [Deltaproteobacteria bacterium]
MADHDDTIRLDAVGLAAFVVALAVIAAILIARLIPSKPEPVETQVAVTPEPPRPTPTAVDNARERESLGTAFEILDRLDPGAGDASAGTLLVSVPCSIDRESLIATMKNVILDFVNDHPGGSCYHLRTYLGSFRPEFCEPVATGSLCLPGAPEMASGRKAWEFRLQLVERENWPPDYKTVEEIEQLCSDLSAAAVCPWKDPFNERKPSPPSAPAPGSTRNARLISSTREKSSSPTAIPIRRIYVNRRGEGREGMRIARRVF